MALAPEKKQTIAAEAKNDFKGVPIGKIICLAKAGWKAYECETGGGQNCIQTLIADIEACFKN